LEQELPGIGWKEMSLEQYQKHRTSLPEAEKGGTCCACGYSGQEETECTAREDKTHCNHWWDGKTEEA